MSFKQLHILCKNKASTKEVQKLVKKNKAIIEKWENQNDKTYSIFLIIDNQDQDFIDSLQDIAKSQDCIRLNISPVDSSFPKKKKDKDEEKKQERPSFFKIVSRETMRDSLSGQASVNGSFLSLVIISAIVASIALIKGNVPILIGAMVLTPLLGPNLALSFSSATADNRLMLKSSITASAGIFLSFFISFLVGYFLSTPVEREVTNTMIHYGFESFVIAACAGIAATILLMQGTVSSLIGVMVAVAFLPPLAMTGLSLSIGEYEKNTSEWLYVSL